MPLCYFTLLRLRALVLSLMLALVGSVLTVGLPWVALAPAEAAGPTTVSGDVTVDTRWTVAMSPILVSGRPTVNPGVTLTIDPGVVVKFSSNSSPGQVNISGISVKGRLVAEGTPSEAIVFTSMFDDTAGGDTDGGGRAPQRGDWNALRFQPSVEQAESVITHASIRYGSSAGAGSCPYEGAVQINEYGRLAMARSEIVKSYAAAVSVADFEANNTQGSASFIQMRFAEAPCAFRALGGTVAFSVIENTVKYGWIHPTQGMATPHGMKVIGNYIDPYVTSYSWNIDGSGTDMVLFRGNYVGIRGQAGSTSASKADLRYNYFEGRVEPGGCATNSENPPMVDDVYTPSCKPITGSYFRTSGYKDLVAPFLTGAPPVPPVGPTAEEWIPPKGIPGAQAWGCACPVTNFTANPINTSVGAKFERATDLVVSAPGVPMEWARSYNGADVSDGPLGAGWTHDFNASLTDDGGAVTFREPSGGHWRFIANPDGTYTPDPGVRGVLTATASGWTLRSPRGFVWTFGLDGRLTKVADDLDRGVGLGYDASGDLITLTDHAGQVTSLDYGDAGASAGKITSVTTDDGRQVTYDYASEAGASRLTSITAANGDVTTIGYNPDGVLASITNGDGETRSIMTYDALTGRAATQRNATGGEWSFSWTPTYVGYGPEGTGVETVTDPDGVVSKDYYWGHVRYEHHDGVGNITRYGYDDELNLVSVTDARGNTTRMTYDHRGNMLSRILPAPIGTTETWTYTDLDQIQTYSNGAGESTSYTYTPSGQLLTVTDPLDRTTTFAYSAAGLLEAIISPGGRTASFAYDAVGNPTAQIAANGGKTTHTYNAAGQLLTTTSPRGNQSGANPADYTTKFTYDAAGLLATKLAPDGNTTVPSYDDAGRITAVTTTDANGTVIDRRTTTYDDAGQVLASTIGGYQGDGGLGTPAEPRTLVGNTYTAAGRLRTTTDQAGKTTTYTYDGAGRVATGTVAHPAGDRVWSYGYDPTGAIATLEDPTNAVTTYTYDNAGRLTTTTPAIGPAVHQTYDAANRVASITGPNGGAVDYTYDDAGQLTSEDYPGLTAVSYSYTADGLKASQTTPGGSITTWSYTPLGLIDTITGPLGNVPGGTPSDHQIDYDYTIDGHVAAVTDQVGAITTFAYDNLGRLATQTDQVNAATKYSYDARSRLATVTAPDATKTEYGYNVHDDLVSRTDANGHTTTFTIDTAGRTTGKTDPLDRTWTYSYDTANNLIGINNPSGSAVTQTYDKLNRIVSRSGTDFAAESFVYRADGLVDSFTDATGTTSLAYNDNALLTNVNGPTSADFTYTYTPWGQVESRTDPNGKTTSYTFDTDGRIAAQSTGGAVTNYGYDTAHRLTDVTYPTATALSEHRDYDAAGRITSISNTGASGLLSKLAYTRDPAGRPTQITTTRGSSSRTDTLTYNSRGWLTAWCKNADGCPSATSKVSFVYDDVGSRLQTTRDGNVQDGGVDIVRQFDQAGQVLDENRIGPDGGSTAFTWNADGQMTTGGRTYDALGRLTGKSTSSGAATYEYNALGHRINTTVGGETASWAWDINNSLPMLATTTDPAGTTSNTYTPDGWALGSLHPNQSYTQTWHSHDAHGSVVDTTRGDGNQLTAVEYDPDGQDETSVHVSTPVDTGFGFTSAYQPPGDSDYHLRARDYTPTLGAFTTLDPVTRAQALPWLTPYNYAENNPALYTDPSGECVVLCGAVAGGLIGGTVYALTHRDDFSWQGLAVATGTGALAGATGGLAGGLVGRAGAAAFPTVASRAAQVAGFAAGSSAGGAAAGLTEAITFSMVTGNGLPSTGELYAAAGSGALFGLLGAAGGKALARLCSRNLPESTAQLPDAAPKAGPTPSNYRGRYNADLALNGVPRLPRDWDAHHRIPQMYRDHPEFANFDFDAPSNIRGVPGNRAGSGTANVHNHVTQEWNEFAAANPNATASQIEAFANRIDATFEGYWWR